MANAVNGVTEGFKQELDIVGVGYRAELKGKQVHLRARLLAPGRVRHPNGIDIAIDKQTHITVTGIDRQLVGQVAANIRRLRKPDPVQAEGRPLHRRSAEEEGRQDRSEVAHEDQDHKKTGAQRISSASRKRIAGTPERPRLRVFRSVAHIYAQVIDDMSGTTSPRRRASSRR